MKAGILPQLDSFFNNFLHCLLITMTTISSDIIQLVQQLVSDPDYITQLDHHQSLALHQESSVRSGIVTCQSLPPEGENEDEEGSEVPNIPLANLSFVGVINAQQSCLGELISFIYMVLFNRLFYLQGLLVQLFLISIFK